MAKLAMVMEKGMGGGIVPLQIPAGLSEWGYESGRIKDVDD